MSQVRETPARVQYTPTPLRVEDVLSMLYLKDGQPVVLSPDGKLVAYTLEDRRRKEKEGLAAYDFVRTGAPDYLEGCNVWVVNTKTLISKNLTRGRGNDWGPEWSPDGRFLAFNSDRSGITHVWVWDRTQKQLRQLSNAVSHMSELEQFQWSPNGKEVLVKLLPEGVHLPGEPPAREKMKERNSIMHEANDPTVRVYMSGNGVHPTAGLPASTSDVAARMRARRADLALVDLASGKVRRVVRGVLSSWAGFSPDGGRLAFANFKPPSGPVRSFQPYYDLLVVSLLTGETRVIAKGVAITAGNVAWSPDGQWLSYSTAEEQSGGLAVMVSATEDGLTRAANTSVPAQFGYSAPLWDESGRFVFALGGDAIWRIANSDGSVARIAQIAHKTIGTILSKPNHREVWSPDGGRSLVVVAQDQDTAKSGFFKVELATGAVTTLLEEEKQYGGDGAVMAALKTAVSDDGMRIVFAAESAQQPEELWTMEMDTQVVERLTRMNPQVDSQAMGEQRVISWVGRDGNQHAGLMLLPSHFQSGRRYPMVVYVYERSLKNANSFGLSGMQFFNLQLFATRGYAVLYPDAPIFRKGEPMQRIADIVLPGIDKAIEMGIADPNNIGVMGHSSGGYMAAALVVQYPFKAAVISAGVTDLFSFYGIPLEDNGTTVGMPWAEDQMGMSGSPWDFRERYFRNSPWFSLDKVTTPILLLAGTKDRPFTAQMDQFFVGLQRLKKEAEYAKYDDEAHAEDWWSAANKLDAAQRMLDWFKKYLNPGPQRYPLAFEGSVTREQ